MKITTVTRKTKTTVGVATVTNEAGEQIGTVVTPIGKFSMFDGIALNGSVLVTNVSRAAAGHAVWRASNGKTKSNRGGDKRSVNYTPGQALVVVDVYPTRVAAMAALGVSKSTAARRVKSGAWLVTEAGIEVV